MSTLLKDVVTSQQHLHHLFQLFNHQCQQQFGMQVDPKDYIMNIFNTVNNYMIEEPSLNEIPYTKKNIQSFNRNIINRMLNLFKQNMKTQDTDNPTNGFGVGESNGNISDLMYRQINERNKAGMKIQMPPQPIDPNQPQIQQSVQTSMQPIQTSVPTTIPSFNGLQDYSLPANSKFISLDFRSDLLDIDDNVYTLRFPSNVKPNSLELYSCQLQSSQYIQKEPALLVNIDQFDGKYTCNTVDGQSHNFFCKLIPFNIVDTIYLFKPEPHVYEVTSKHDLSKVIVISFNTFEGVPFSLTKIDVDKIKNVAVNINKINGSSSFATSSTKEKKARISTKHSHGLEKNDTVLITYLCGDEFKAVRFDVFHVIDDNTFVVDGELEFTKNVTVHKQSLKCSITFKYT